MMVLVNALNEFALGRTVRGVLETPDFAARAAITGCSR